MTKTKKIFWFFFGGGVIIVCLALGFAFIFPTDYFACRSDLACRVHALQSLFKQWEAADYRAAMSDRYGGKTPQETFALYFDAVKKGDYDLASKYIIAGNRDEQKKNLILLKEKNNMPEYLDILNRMKPDSDTSGGSFRMREATNSGPSHYMRFRLYPNGVWKIIEI